MLTKATSTHRPSYFGPILALLLSFLTLTGCARPDILLERVLVRNATAGTITDVEVRHEPTMRFGAVNAILPANAYELAFARQPMLAKEGVVAWRDDTGRQWSRTLALPEKNVVRLEGQAVSLVYVIAPNGEVTVSLQP